MSFKTTATISTFSGHLLKLAHDSISTSTSMSLNLYLPPQSSTRKVPVLFYLAGLTCTGDNGAEKGFFHQRASEKGIAIVYPDTSPRGLEIAGQDDHYDFGSGAGFYINATKEPWSTNYKMEDYITKELPQLLFKEFSDKLDSSRVSITGHSMGGHGALTLYLKHPDLYKSVSAFAPIANPSNCPWGEKAFSGYFGSDREAWKAHDATELIKKHKGAFECLIDVGTGDNFYKQGQLLPEKFAAAAKETGNDGGLEVRYQDGYDHSYFFISTFASSHVDHAAKFLFA